MKTEFVRFLFPLTVLLLGGALEEVLPKAWSVGFPILMTAALVLGGSRARADAVLLAILAGTMEDALSSLPLATTASFLIAVSFCTRAVPVPCLAAILAYPVYQFWLVVWTNLPAGELWARLFVSVPVSVATVLLVQPVLRTCERRLLPDAR